ncbi:uncharacterized protein N7477_001071 [Penicillium maclennaniae]|uniref:uncharacterized protein n=1 Tax=Penicillium maclennaniae TaxID=1343394 RepID=UPI002540CFFE|nr:uncharacterized protein N7477_001071 [Penicillium maclennaniae]KAJ5684726.1 hypothetical protein N7477_001071 [Penicillium maclennaniae]
MPTKSSKRTVSQGKTSTPQTNTTTAPNTKHPSLSPANITPKIFHDLLALYPQTVTAVHNRKNTLKLQPKPKTAKRKAEALDIAPTEPNSSLEETVRSETAKFIELDTWRYEEMPQTLSKRKSETNGEKGYLDKAELIRIMEWKLCVPSPFLFLSISFILFPSSRLELDKLLHTKPDRKHGHFRPTLMGMIKSNAEKVVLECTSSAISLLPEPSTTPNVDSEGDLYPKESFDALTRLRGVGVATASLILSIATASSVEVDEVPFYSDDTFLWLCAGCYPGSEEEEVRKYLKPNGDLGVKYNVNEYRLLWEKMEELRGRLNRPGEGEDKIRFVDIERVAFVVRNFDDSGFDVGGDDGGGDEVDEKGVKKVKT